MKNPYSLLFGREPEQYIRRAAEAEEIIQNFSYESPSEQIYMITGVRGSGKTVFMTEISNQLKKDKDWIVIELSSESNLLENLASHLASENSRAEIFKKAKINLSFWGFGLEVGGTAPITNIQLAITKMMEELKNHKKKVLVTIDEVVNNKSMKEFASAFQIFVRQNLPICLLMTGLFENIDELQNQKNLTFLYRAPKIYLNPLNKKEIAYNYKNTLKINDEDATEMSGLTNGYSFAFQVLGYFAWENNGDFRKVINKYKNYVSEYSYDKIWAELSNKDREILFGIANAPSGKIVDIRNYLGISTNEFNPYRKRLIKKGLINGEQYGYVKFVLPFFDEYVNENWSV
ncbi:MAG: ATP-binding protein [Lachnospiraceae bacterium]|nr:ATP-binding protein [Lachnospiraceae bacterium]